MDDEGDDMTGALGGQLSLFSGKLAIGDTNSKFNNENSKTKSLKLFDSILNGKCPADFVFESLNL